MIIGLMAAMPVSVVAFVMLFGPENFQQFAQAEMQYANLSTASWANGNTTITYTYDANGSVKTKTTAVGKALALAIPNGYTNQQQNTAI